MQHRVQAVLVPLPVLPVRVQPPVDADQLERLGEGIDQLSKRGAKESLVLMDDMAMIVGVPKKTVITAMSRNEAMGNIFTNIDSTLVVD